MLTYDCDFLPLSLTSAALFTTCKATFHTDRALWVPVHIKTLKRNPCSCKYSAPFWTLCACPFMCSFSLSILYSVKVPEYPLSQLGDPQHPNDLESLLKNTDDWIHSVFGAFVKNIENGEWDSGVVQCGKLLVWRSGYQNFPVMRNPGARILATTALLFNYFVIFTSIWSVQFGHTPSGSLLVSFCKVAVAKHPWLNNLSILKHLSKQRYIGRETYVQWCPILARQKRVFIFYILLMHMPPEFLVAHHTMMY